MKNPSSQSRFFTLRILLAFVLCSVGVSLGMLSLTAQPLDEISGHAGPIRDNAATARATRPRFAPTGPGWSIITSPNTNATQNNRLESVTCPSASQCWAVGYYGQPVGSEVSQTLIEHWDGTTWTIVPSPNTSATQDNLLKSVTCTSTSQCWAVGYYGDYDHVVQALIEQWDGTAWTIVPSPNTAAYSSALYGVTCPSASQCWAVGYYSQAAYSGGQTLIEQWDGTAWATFPSPNDAASFNGLNAVTCPSASQCWAVGVAAGDYGETLTEQWNGTSWNIIASPNLNFSSVSILGSVACSSTSQCWTVGYVYDGDSNSINFTLIDRWNGTSWSMVPSPQPSQTRGNNLNGVACTSASQCWAVGNYGIDSSGSAQTLIAQWNGTSWTTVASPNTSTTQYNGLQGVTCASPSQCWAVGNYLNGSGHIQTLIEEYSLTIPPLTSVASRMTHGSAGTFDINLPLTGTPGVECRNSASLGAGNYTMMFTFTNNLTSVATAGLTSGTGSVSTSTLGPNANQYTVNLTGVTNLQYVTVTLSNVLDAQNNIGNVAGTMGVLIGDTTADAAVNSGDIGQTKSQSGNPVSATNFREDVNADGNLNSADIGLVKSKSGTALP